MKPLILQNRTNPDSITIPNIFVDNFISEANGEFVKIYLYLLRCISDPAINISISMLADKFNHTENDVIRALRYWEKAGLLSLSYDSSERELTGITVLPAVSTKKQEQEHFQVPSAKISAPKAINTDNISNTDIPIIIEPIAERMPKPVYTSTQLKQFAQKEDLSQLLYIAQKYLGKTLTSTETNTIIYFYESLAFPADLIEYLIEYCVSREHKSMRYIEKVALGWADAGIKTVSQAKKEASLYSTSVYSIMKAFGITNRNPGTREQDYIKKWNDVYCFEPDIIIEACNRTIQAIHQPSFEYADSILSKWKDSNISHISDLNALDEQHAAAKASKERLSIPKSKQASSGNNRFNNFPQRDYDFDELEKQLLGNNN